MKKLVKRKNILKEAGVLLVAAILVLTSIFVFTPLTRVTKAQPPLWSEDFSTATPPSLPLGWTTDPPSNINWKTSNSNCAGGTSPEAMFHYYPSSAGTFRLITSITLPLPVGTNCDLYFRHCVNHYSGPYDLYVETRLTGTTPWDPPIWNQPSGSCPPTRVGPITILYQGTFDLSFTFVGYSWNINWWCIDDIEIIRPNSPPTPPTLLTPTPPPSVDACNPPTVTWSGSIDPDPGDTVTYEVYLDDGTGSTTTPGAFSLITTVSAPTTFCNLADPSLGLELLSGKTYWWNISANDGHNPAVPSSNGPWYFTTDPSAFSINSITTSITTNGYEITLTITNSGSTVHNPIIKMEFVETGTGCCNYKPLTLSNPTPGYGNTPTPPPIIAEWAVPTFNNGNKDFTVKIKGCSCFDLIITVDACGASPPSGRIQEIRHGNICDLDIW